MNVTLTLVIGLMLFALQTVGQSPPFNSSNLPVLCINTQGHVIHDSAKITAQLKVIDGPNRNLLIDPASYEGVIGIKIHGASSKGFPKKQYRIETRDEHGNGIDVPLLGLPAEEDWILHAPYVDKSLMRDVLAYDLARAMGRYASRTKFCELVLNGQYQGVYVLVESIKRDKNRLAINKMTSDDVEGDDLSGGYLLRTDRDPDWRSPYRGYHSTYKPTYQIREPRPQHIVQDQKNYIQNFITDFEAMMNSEHFESESSGYPAIIDVGSFVDEFLLEELSNNVDGYRLSTYMYKDRDSIDPLLYAGPVWDFNLAFGNANYGNGASTTGFQVTHDKDSCPVPFWWVKLSTSETFRDSVRARWSELRTDVFNQTSISGRIDEISTLLDEAQTRNFQRWPVLGGAVYEDELNKLKQWIGDRIRWLDSQFQ